MHFCYSESISQVGSKTLHAPSVSKLAVMEVNSLQLAVLCEQLDSVRTLRSFANDQEETVSTKTKCALKGIRDWHSTS
jgi:hypothetical protein